MGTVHGLLPKRRDKLRTFANFPGNCFFKFSYTVVIFSTTSFSVWLEMPTCIWVLAPLFVMDIILVAMAWLISVKRSSASIFNDTGNLEIIIKKVKTTDWWYINELSSNSLSCLIEGFAKISWNKFSNSFVYQYSIKALGKFPSCLIRLKLNSQLS